ncbi:homoserine dehydrogenase [Catonella morbi ATCC 51271]|uniref:Homoserine dehydrogenase n=1 Tax=Catonella morbi ATCC 51271 TaxID=592026 RepID=V2XIA5_9FIRM|nr:homoserine dehydrogenase [Catonella morbi]ESL01904.1 homoserine dehydrogenase [Catonella morbi ATCC 51271]
MVNVGIIGYGTVGSGVFEVLNTNSKSIAVKAGEEIKVKRICDLRDFPGDAAEKLITHDFNDILNDDEITIVVETMGGTKPAYDFVKASIEAGKSVCTSNKELVAKFGAGLIKLAEKHNVNFLFEASVGGGIPIIRPLNYALTAEEILEIKGILNGTTNFILTKMNDEGLDYETVLKEAQDMGYAEKNPTADVEGFDTCRKIAILTSLAYGKQVDFEDIRTEGITKITKEDMEYAKALNASIKLIGESKKENGTVYARVAPALIDREQPLYSVHDVFNAIFVKGNMVDDVMFYGRGAGKLPTASAVVADVIDAAKHKNKHIPIIWEEDKLELGDIREYKQKFFVRVPADMKEAVKQKMPELEEVKTEKVKGEFAFITPVLTENEFEEAVKDLKIINRIIVNFK